LFKDYSINILLVSIINNSIPSFKIKRLFF
jgi:hypothetical protein